MQGLVIQLVAKKGWRKRLAAAIERDGRSATEISVAAGLSHGYLHSILRDIKPQDPTIEKLRAVVNVLPGVTMTYILEGFEISPESERLLKVWSRYPPERRAGFLDLLFGPTPEKEE